MAAPSRPVAWLVHLYTASGAVLAYLAAVDTFNYRFREALLWLAAALVVDATDGALARLARVKEALPGVNGAALDDIVDYLTYVFVPVLLVWRAILVPEPWMPWVCGAMLLSSALGFVRAEAKTPDHFFTGFPSYWNIVVCYLLLCRWPQPVNGVLLAVLAALVFTPLRFVYPSRTPVLRPLTNLLGTAWALLLLWIVWSMPAVPRAWVTVSFAFPVYYTGLSLALQLGRRRPASAGIS